LLSRWQSLEKDDALQHAVSSACTLVIGLALIFVVFAVITTSSGLVAVAAAAMGWVIAESCASHSPCAVAHLQDLHLLEAGGGFGG
jgi:hypothetical protein